MDLRLSGKQALVGGSTRGIGFAAASQLAQQGARVILLARDREKLKEALNKLPGSGHSMLCADFSRPQELQQELQQLSSTVHILVNNTGGPPAGRAVDADIASFQEAFHIHLICNQVLAQRVIPGMKSAGYGRIINVISTSVKQPIPMLGVSNTIRGAVANWAKTLAGELGEFGITVNNVLPGYTTTGRLQEIIDGRAQKQGKDSDSVAAAMRSTVPAGRFAAPEEVANVIGFLASPAAAYVNGINLPVDGGRTGCL